MKPDPNKLIEDTRIAIEKLLKDISIKTFEERNLLRSKVWEIRLHSRCEHKTKVVVKDLLSNGRTILQEQCCYCGHTSGAIKQSPEALKNAIDKIDFGPADSLIAELYNDAITKIESLYEINRKITYDNYLNSEIWKARTRLVIARDGGLCKAQLAGCVRQATDVHHLTYTYFGNEPLFTLVSVCRPCHQKMTEMEGRHK